MNGSWQWFTERKNSISNSNSISVALSWIHLICIPLHTYAYQFLVNVLFLYPWKYQKTIYFLMFRGYRMGTLVWNRFTSFSLCRSFFSKWRSRPVYQNCQNISCECFLSISHQLHYHWHHCVPFQVDILCFTLLLLLWFNY